MASHALLDETSHGIGTFLSNQFLDYLALHPETGGGLLDEKLLGQLREVRDLIYLEHPVPRVDAEKTQRARQQRFDDLLAELTATPDRFLAFQDALVRIEHFYTLGAQVARDNFLKTRDERALAELAEGKAFSEVEFAPGGAMGFAQRAKSLDAALTRIGTPRMEFVLTAHPTNIETLEFIKQQKVLATTVEELRAAAKEGNEARIGAELWRVFEGFATAKLTPQQDGKADTLTVRDEIDLGVYYATNDYEFLPATYARYDRANALLAQQTGETYDPLDLRLNLKIHSWASAGDRDGNLNVRSENTLEAIALHRRQISRLYADALTKINDPALDTLRETLDTQAKAFDSLLAEMERLRAESTAKHGDKHAFFLTNEEFDAFSATIAAQTFDAKQLETALTNVYRALPPEQRIDAEGNVHPVLTLLRQVRTFEDHLAPIEYRQTAEVYEDVIHFMLEAAKAKGVDHIRDALGDTCATLEEALWQIDVAEPITYQLLTHTGYVPLEGDRKIPWPEPLGEQLAEARRKVMNHLLKTPDYAAELRALVADEIARGEGKKYDDPEFGTHARAFQSLRCMELARDHPSLFHTHVLAEAQGACNFLELQFLQEAVAVGKGSDRRQARMNIVPLFEEPNSFEAAPDVMKSAMLDPCYQRHLQGQMDFRGCNHWVQEWQAAQSDTRRRGGMPGAAGVIAEAMDRMKVAFATINETLAGQGRHVENHPFIGGSHGDMARNGGRSETTTINAYGLHPFYKTTIQGIDARTRMNDPLAFERMIERIVECSATRVEVDGLPKMERFRARDRRYLDEAPLLSEPARQLLNRIVYTAYKQCVGDHAEHFTEESIGSYLAALDYDLQTEIGNVSSRAKGRPASAMGARKTAPAGSTIPVTTIRTISGTETLGQGGTLLAGQGGEHMFEYLDQEIEKFLAGKSSFLNERRAEFPAVSEAAIVEVRNALETARAHSPQALRQLVGRNSRTAKGMNDTLLLSSTLSDFDLAEQVYPIKDNLYYGHAREEQQTLTKEAILAVPRPAGDVDLPEQPVHGETESAWLRRVSAATMPHARADLDDKRRELEWGGLAWRAVRNLYRTAESTTKDTLKLALRAIHDGNDSALYVPTPLVTDISYSAAKHHEAMRARPANDVDTTAPQAFAAAQEYQRAV